MDFKKLQNNKLLFLKKYAKLYSNKKKSLPDQFHLKNSNKEIFLAEKHPMHLKTNFFFAKISRALKAWPARSKNVFRI